MTTKSRKRVDQTAFRSIEEFKRRYFPSIVAAEAEQEKNLVSLGISDRARADALRQLAPSVAPPKNLDLLDVG